MRKGDIVLIPFPFTDLRGIKNRPALVLYVALHDVTVAFITSQLIQQEPFDIAIKPNTINGLKVDSIVKLGKIATIEKSLVIGKMGLLNSSEIATINKNLIHILGL